MKADLYDKNSDVRGYLLKMKNLQELEIYQPQNDWPVPIQQEFEKSLIKSLNKSNYPKMHKIYLTGFWILNMDQIYETIKNRIESCHIIVQVQELQIEKENGSNKMIQDKIQGIKDHHVVERLTMKNNDHSTSLLNFKIHLCKSKFNMKRPDPEKQNIKIRPELSKSVIDIENGLIQVHFPYEKPYQCQENYIKSLVKALRKKQNALLESPTGTGKTLCLLSGTLGFLKAYSDNPSIFDEFDENGKPLKHINSSQPDEPDEEFALDNPDAAIELQKQKTQNQDERVSSQQDNEEAGKKNYLNQDKRIMVIYCTRTHSQISQVIKEIKNKLAYEINVVPLASRKHMCIFGEQFEEESVDQVCKLAREKNQKYQKKRFQTLLNSDKVNFRGYQKSLMRIMDGISKKKKPIYKKDKSHQNYTFDLDQDNPEDEKKNQRKRMDIRQQEEKLRQYEETIFVQNIIETNTTRNKKQNAKEFDDMRRKHQSGVCPYYNGGEKRIFETELNVNPFFEKMQQKILTQPVYDIEDLNKVGKMHSLCPYYLARSKLSNVDIAVIPYHYILTPSIRRKLPLKIENSVIIFDEAHNLERICEEIMSFKLSVDKLIQCEKILQKLETVYREKDSMSANVTNQNNDKAGDKLDETEILRCFIDHLRRAIDIKPNMRKHVGEMERGNIKYYLFDIQEVHNILDEALQPVFRIDKQEKKKRRRQQKKSETGQDQNDDDQDNGNDSPIGMSSASEGEDEQWQAVNGGFNAGDLYYNELKDKNLTDKERKQRARVLMINKRVDELLEVLDQCIADMQSDSKALSKLKNSLKTVQHLSKITERERQDFRLYIEEVTYIANKNVPGRAFEASKKLLGYICLNPSYIFKQLVKKNPRSIILTSGTLSPMDSFADELRTVFGVQLENQHAIDKSQLMVSVVQCDFNQHQFNFVYDRRKNYDQIIGLGKFIQKLEKNIPGGILLFFPSYELMAEIMSIWDQQQILYQRQQFKEAKNGKEFKEIFDKYLKCIQRGKRAMLMCVCRGKLSEGIDFIDDAARAIFVIGIPYPCVNDPRVVQKQEYLDQKHKEEPNFEIDGGKWYKLQASRTVNQAIGRVIRHIRDFGAVFLCDERYGGQMVEISKWMKDRRRIYDKKNIQNLENEVVNFFKLNTERFKTSQCQIQKKLEEIASEKLRKQKEKKKAKKEKKKRKREEKEQRKQEEQSNKGIKLDYEKENDDVIIL
eukprot:403341333